MKDTLASPAPIASSGVTPDVKLFTIDRLQWSPDGKSLLFTAAQSDFVNSGYKEIYTVDLQSNLNRVTKNT